MTPPSTFCRSCPFVESSTLDDEGCVPDHVIYPMCDTIVHLRPGDSIYDEHQAEKAHDLAVEVARVEREERFHAYTQSKLNGKSKDVESLYDLD